jgi:hypothetical protein
MRPAGGWRGPARRGAALGLALLAAGPAAGAELRRVESVGVAPVRGAAEPTPLRDSAVRAALGEAVARVAGELLAGLPPERVEAALDQALGGDPADLTARYRVLEDRGERPALFSSEPGVDREYVVVAEVEVYEERVRRRLIEAGWLPPSGGAAAGDPVTIEAEGDYDGYAALRRLLSDELRLGPALPVELSRDRSVIRVDSDRSPEALLEALLSAPAPGVRITPLGAQGRTLRLRIEVERAPGSAGAEPPETSPGEAGLAPPGPASD